MSVDTVVERVERAVQRLEQAPAWRDEVLIELRRLAAVADQLARIDKRLELQDQTLQELFATMTTFANQFVVSQQAAVLRDDATRRELHEVRLRLQSIEERNSRVDPRNAQVDEQIRFLMTGRWWIAVGFCALAALAIVLHYL